MSGIALSAMAGIRFVSIFDSMQIGTGSCQLVYFRGSETQPLGTCFAISNEGLAVTARHVLDYAFGISDLREYPKLNLKSDESLSAVYASQEVDPSTGHLVGGPLPILNCWIHSGLDIALLQLNIPTDTLTNRRLRVPALALSPGIPKTGQHCYAFGYHAMKWTHKENLSYEVRQNYSASRGLIEEIHFPQRDAAVLSFPCFRTSARFDAGMSGGPIVSEAGQVCGVVCSALKTDESDGSFTHRTARLSLRR